MTLEQLHILKHIVELGSIKAAAISLHKTQPALTMAIKKLEKEYGFAIFDRSQYRLALTSSGKTFYRKSIALLSNAEQLRSMGQHLGSGNEARLRITYDLYCPHYTLMSALAQTQRQYPDTDVHLFGESRFRPLELLQKSEVDIAISPWWPTFYALGNFDTVNIGEFRLILVASPTLLAGVKIEEAQQLKSLVELTSYESKLGFDSENLTLLTGVHQWKTKDTQTLKHMLLAGLGWGLVPEHLVKREIQEGDLVQLQLKDMESIITGEVRAIRTQDTTLGPVGAHLWQTFKDTIEQD